MADSDSTTHRTCNWCNQTKPLIGGFRKTRGKYFRKCKECTDRTGRVWVESHRELVREIKRRYIERNPEKHLESREKWVGSARHLEAVREWKKANRDRVNARNRELFAERHPPLIARLARRKQREAEAEGVFTKQDEDDLMARQLGRCAGCEASLIDAEYHIDHILPLVRGGNHWPVNRQILCPACNHKKGTMTNKEWLTA